MSNVIKNDYIVKGTLNYEDYSKSNYYYSYSLVRYNTDIFNKPSRTTVCFEGAHNSMVMYCENCDETHYNQMSYEVELREYPLEEDSDSLFGKHVSQKAHITKVICKKCGSVYNLEDIRIIERSDNARYSGLRAVYHKVYSEDEYVKLSLKTCSMVVERAFYSVDNRYKIIFNTKTGQTYLYNSPENKKNKVKPLEYNMALENINFNASNFDYLFNKCLIDTENQEVYKVDKIKEMYNLMYEKISSNLGYNPKTLEEYAKEFNETADKSIYSFEVLALYNRFPNLNPFGLLELNGHYYSNVPVLKKLRKIKNTCKNPLLELSRLYNVKHFELFEKYYNEGSSKLYWLIYFSQFLENKSYLEELSNMYNHFTCIVNEPHEVDNLLKKRYSLNNSISLLFKHISKIMSEDNLCNIFKKYIEDSNFRYGIQNLSNIYYLAKKINPKTKIDMHYVSNMLCGILNGLKQEECLENITSYIFKILDKSSYEKNKKKFKFKINTLEEYRNAISGMSHDNNILISTLYNIAPHFNPYTLSEILFGCMSEDYTLAEKFDIKDYLDDITNDVLGDIFREFNIPNIKSFRKKISCNPKWFKNLVFFNSLFTDVNVINNLLDNLKYGNRIDYSLLSVKDFLSAPEEVSIYPSLEYQYKVIKRLIDAQGETIAGKKISQAYKNGMGRDLEDIWPMYETHLQLYPNEEVDLTGSIKEIHDRLITLTGGAYQPFTKKDLKPFKYTKEEKELEFEHEGYSFKLAHDAKELAVLGNDLKNCVRGYAKRARNKNCYIVAVSFEDKYKICIELEPSKDSNYKYSLRQAKLFANTPVYKEKDALNAVLEWMNVNNIEDKSYDIKRADLPTGYNLRVVEPIAEEEPVAQEMQLRAFDECEYHEDEYDEDMVPF